MKFLLLLFFLISCQDYNTNSFDRTRYGNPVGEGPAKIIQNKCINCHSGEHDSWAGLTDAQWVATGLVIPGDPDNSLFIKRIYNTGISGVSNMPIGGGALPNDEYQALKDWIQNIP